MRYLLLLAIGCSSPAPAPPDAEPFGGACVPSGQAPVSTCTAGDDEIGWCIDGACRRNCIDGACPKGGEPMPVEGDCYCK